MKLTIASDLHLDVSHMFDPIEFQPCEKLLLAGDIAEAQNYPFKWMERQAKKIIDIYLIMGNHEHYGFDVNRTHEYLRARMPDNVHLLDGGTRRLDENTILFGATMWTDMNRNDWFTKQRVQNYMVDFHAQHGGIINGERSFHPDDCVTLHNEAKNKLLKVLAESDDKRVVVMTHHAPSRKSVHPRFSLLTKENGGFVSDLDAIITSHPNIALWVHGHTHDPYDYMLGETRVVCNPRGYVNRQRRERAHFNPDFVVEL